MVGLVLLWVHRLLELLEVLYRLALHGHQVDPAEKQCHLDVLEVLVGLVDLVIQDIPGIQEGPRCLSQGVPFLLYSLSSLAIRQVL